MKRQPYIYTMPEQFIHDDSVPAHWKLYALINGFWLSGKPVYASNAWFVERLKVSDRHIRRSLAILERLGLLDRRLEGGRLIFPGGRTSGVRGGGPGVPIKEDVGGPPISISNSVNKKELSKNDNSTSSKSESSQSIELRDVDNDGMAMPPRRAKVVGDGRQRNAEIMALVKKCIGMFKREFDVEPVTGVKDYMIVKAALKHIKPAEVIQMVEDSIADGRAQKSGMSLSAILSSNQINKFLLDNS